MAEAGLPTFAQASADVAAVVKAETVVQPVIANLAVLSSVSSAAVVYIFLYEGDRRRHYQPNRSPSEVLVIGLTALPSPWLLRRWPYSS